MKNVQILEADDIIEANDWVRPLQIISMSCGLSDFYSFTNEYTGDPENNAKWVQVKQLQIGDRIVGRTVKDVCRLELQEFLRGDVPITHRYGKTKKDRAEIYSNYLKKTISPAGKFEGCTLEWIKENQRSYFSWMQSRGYAKSLDHFDEEFIPEETESMKEFNEAFIEVEL